MMAMLQQKRPKPLRRLGFGPTRQEAPGGFEPPITDLQSADTCPDSQGTTPISDRAGADARALETKNVHDDPHLQAIIDVWPDLPEAIRAGILAMVKSTSTTV